MNILIPMAGRGSRFLQEKERNQEYRKPKPIINISGKLMIEWALSSLPNNRDYNLIFLVLKEHIENFGIDGVLRERFGQGIKIVVVDKVTEGAACTALLAKEHINNDQPLLITDSDHYIDGHTLIKDIDSHEKVAGIIPVFYANNPKWSFSKTNNEGEVIEIAEKIQISRNANIGAYYFSKGRDFVWAAEEMIEEDDRTNGEFYIAPVYNYLIRRGKIIRLSRPRFVHGLGTPKDVEKFIEFLRLGEIEHSFSNLNLKGEEILNKAKIKAILFDLDGVLVDAVKLHQSCFIEAVKPYRDMDEDYHMKYLNGLPTKKKLEKLGFGGEMIEKINNKKQEITFEMIPYIIKPIEEVKRVIKKIKEKNIPFAVCTNSIRESSERMLAAAHIEGFEFLISNQDVSNPKPDPEIYLKAIEKTGLDKENILIVEDSPVGIESASATGANICEIKNPYNISKVLEYIK